MSYIVVYKLCYKNVLTKILKKPRQLGFLAIEVFKKMKTVNDP